MTLTDKFLKLVQKAPQINVQSQQPSPAYQILHTWFKTGANDQPGVVPYVLDGTVTPKAFLRDNVTVVNAVDPTTLDSADIIDGDQWYNISTPAHPVLNLRVAGAWVVIATAP